jgi:hypothetical protein
VERGELDLDAPVDTYVGDSLRAAVRVMETALADLPVS